MSFKNQVWKDVSFIVMAVLFLLFIVSPVWQDVIRQNAMIMKLLITLPQQL